MAADCEPSGPGLVAFHPAGAKDARSSLLVTAAAHYAGSYARPRGSYCQRFDRRAALSTSDLPPDPASALWVHGGHALGHLAMHSTLLATQASFSQAESNTMCWMSCSPARIFRSIASD
ncbi:hypothetical protein CFIMG_002984RA [Ceratocystis fimbriata CBS 114723]|uniref:Uncharacterized protein n=1 Tax=Ceratocystis fimbriata CBS 114723 TaxID=1035309 RepID=A0A2C5WVM7_9PEZI|nr:hypothetical protein CFIMG_002984RA [Ceratocystis fimbriata CBS 114723]